MADPAIVAGVDERLPDSAAAPRTNSMPSASSPTVRYSMASRTNCSAKFNWRAAWRSIGAEILRVPRNSCGQSVEQRKPWNRGAAANMILAMAQFKLNQTNEARETFADGLATANRTMDKLGDSLRDWTTIGTHGLSRRPLSKRRRQWSPIKNRKH